MPKQQQSSDDRLVTVLVKIERHLAEINEKLSAGLFYECSHGHITPMPHLMMQILQQVTGLDEHVEPLKEGKPS